MKYSIAMSFWCIIMVLFGVIIYFIGVKRFQKNVQSKNTVTINMLIYKKNILAKNKLIIKSRDKLAKLLDDDDTYLRNEQSTKVGCYKLTDLHDLYNVSHKYINSIKRISSNVLMNQQLIRRYLLNMNRISKTQNFSSMNDTIFSFYFQYNQNINELINNPILNKFLDNFNDIKISSPKDLQFYFGMVMGVFITLDSSINELTKATNYIKNHL